MIKTILDKNKNDDLTDDEIQQIEDYLNDIKQLDENTFTIISEVINSLSTYLEMVKENKQLWGQCQSLLEKFRNESDETKKQEISSKVYEIQKSTFLNRERNTLLRNSKYSVTGMFQNMSPNVFSNIYNENGEYYSYFIDEKVMNSFNINEFARFCENVTNEPQEIQVSRKDYIVNYLLPNILGDYLYQTYLDAVENYLYSSNRDALNTITEITLNNSDLLELNRIVTSDVGVVYRGLSFYDKNDADYEEILNGNIITSGNARFVSTSTSKSVAQQFAESKNVGLILTIEPGTVIYSSDIAGGVFGESEIIIDMSDSTIIEIEEV